MIKKTLTYADVFGEPITDTLYFHLNKFEWLEIETFTKGGLIQNLNSALETKNNKKVIDLLKKIILKSYGERDPETGAFLKSDDISIRFSKTEAFSELFFQLVNDSEESKNFFMGLIPKEARSEAEKRYAEYMKTGELPKVQPPTSNE